MQNPTVNNIGYMRKTLNDQQLGDITELAKTLPSNSGGSDFLFCQLGNADSCSVAFQLERAFKNAGWDDKRIGLLEGIVNNPPDPLVIAITPTPDLHEGEAITASTPLPQGALALANLLHNDGISVVFSLDKRVPLGTFWIEVGNQP